MPIANAAAMLKSLIHRAIPSLSCDAASILQPHLMNLEAYLSAGKIEARRHWPTLGG